MSETSAAASPFDACRRLDGWLQTMRSPSGFTGPIAHWWESCLLYCGPMIDWRYEGILCGYLSLYEATRERLWLDRARQAGDDVLRGRLPGGSFRNSSFQYGPIEGGTPHEAAVDVGLLELARVLRDEGMPWTTYFDAAEQNLTRFHLGALWDGRGFRDQPSGNDIHVPNKNGTVLEALVLYEQLSGADMSQFLDGALNVILSAQVRSGRRAGATIHTGTGARRLAIGIYTARSFAAVLRYHDRSPRDELLDATERALLFLDGLVTPQGTTFGYDGGGRAIANPRWIAASGDLLRLAIRGEAHGLTPPGLINRLTRLLVEQQLPTGALPTAHGFAAKGGSSPHHGPPEIRDLLPVVGWCDKAFRALALLPSPSDPGSPATSEPVTRECTWKGRRLTYEETTDIVSLRDAATGRPRYRWRKGEVWPDVYVL
jgi:hypothetical protein